MTKKYLNDGTAKKPDGYFNSDRHDMLKYVPKWTKRTLEFGCGFGNFSLLVKKTYGTEAWGVEIENKAAELAKLKLDKVIHTDCETCIELLPDNYFDCIIAFDILEHLVEPDSLLAKIKTKLSKDGLVIASIPNIRYWRAFVDYAVFGNWNYKDHGIMDRTHLRFYTHKSVINLFESQGYELVVFEGIHPTSSKNYKIVNFLMFNILKDVRHKHFAVVAKPKQNE